MRVAATVLGGRYRLDEAIGAGGFCEVWRATDTVLARPVAVKLLCAGYADQPEARDRFKAEARHAGAVAHENIARVYDFGEPGDGQPYLVMELIEGPSLAAVLAGGPLDPAQAMDIVAQAAAGLQAAHSAGLIHRDVKPANLLFTPEGTVRITDFGIAHAVGSAPLTATGMVLGTPGYLAPERVAGAQAQPASDLYALGIVAFECLAGVRPFRGAPLEVAAAHRDRPLPPLPARVPTGVAEFVTMLTAKDPRRRPASAGEAARQAGQLRDGLVPGPAGALPVFAGAPRTAADAPQGQAGGTISDWTHTGRSHRRRMWGAAAVAAALAVLICLVPLSTSGGTPASPAAAAQPFAGPARPVLPLAKAPSAASPVAARHAARRPSAARHTRTRTVVAVRHRPTRHHIHRVGRRHHKHHPGG